MSESMAEHRGCLNRLLSDISQHLDELDVLDASASEEAICKLLVDNGFMKVVGFGSDMEECPPKVAEWCEYRAI